jgi:uncharacterized membrane protein
MAWFPLFPWAAWPLVGVAIGHIWVRQARISKRREALVFILSGIVGMALIYGVTLVRRINPYIIHYPSDVVQQMGPGAFIYRLGMIGPMATAGWLICRLLGDRFSIMRQFGRTSLLIYWIHVDLCYGLISGRLHGRLNMTWATVGFVAMTGLMLAVSIYKTRSGEVWKRRLAALRRRRPRPRRRPAPEDGGACPRTMHAGGWRAYSGRSRRASTANGWSGRQSTATRRSRPRPTCSPSARSPCRCCAV